MCFPPGRSGPQNSEQRCLGWCSLHFVGSFSTSGVLQNLAQRYASPLKRSQACLSKWSGCHEGVHAIQLLACTQCRSITVNEKGDPRTQPEVVNHLGIVGGLHWWISAR